MPGAVLNAAESALCPNLKMKKSAKSLAIVWKDEGADDLPARTLTYAELRVHVKYGHFSASSFPFA